ncbi:MAG: helix-turn-helix domain-containing protein [Actinomycetota bacterium]|nr:helix-turn-helix domain-containing protein [Actinomycetota bacterium]
MAKKSTATTTATAATVPEIDGLVNLEATARILGVSHGSVRNYISRGDLPSVKMGARRMVRRSELQDFIENLEA